MSDDEHAKLLARQRLEELIRETPGENFASVSALLGRNHAYIQQYLRRGRPARLAPRDVRLIASRFGVPESLIDGFSPGARPCGLAEAGARAVYVPQFGDRPETGVGGATPFRADRLAALATGDPTRLAILVVGDHAMYPTLAAGDEVLVDLARRQPGGEALFAVRLGTEVEIRRVSVNPVTGRLAIRTDNPLHADWPDCDPAAITILGRALWAGKRL